MDDTNITASPENGTVNPGNSTVGIVSESASAPVVNPQAVNLPDEDFVKVPKAAFDSIMERMAKLEAEQKLMLAVEDKNKIRKIEELRNAGKLVKNIKLNVIDNKIVTAYKMVKDEVYQTTDGRLIENQELEVIFDDGTNKVIAVRQWAAFTSYIEAEVVKESREADGEVFYTVQTPDGKEVVINVRFVN